MGRPKKNKKAAVKEPKATKSRKNQPVNDPIVAKTSVSVDEAADIFGISSDCVRLWIDHGHLHKENVNGPPRISMDSILGCRFKRYSQ